MKKYLFTLLLISVVAVAGGIVYVSMPREDAVVDFEISAEDFSMVVNTEKQIKYSLSINPSRVYVEMFEDDSTILTIEKRAHKSFFAQAVGIGSTTLTIYAKYGKSEATKVINVYVVSDESELVDLVPENFESAVNKDNITNCTISENTINMSLGMQARFSASLGTITLTDAQIQNTNPELEIERIDLISFYTFGITASATGTFDIRVVLNNSITFDVSVVVTE